jgi:hypothetical protein
MLQLFLKNDSYSQIKKYILDIEKNIKEDTYDDQLLEKFHALYGDFWINEKVKLLKKNIKKNKNKKKFYSEYDLNRIIKNVCDRLPSGIIDLICCYFYNFKLNVDNYQNTWMSDLYYQDIIISINCGGMSICDIYNGTEIYHIDVSEISNMRTNYNRTKIFVNDDNTNILVFVYFVPTELMDKYLLIFDIVKNTYQFIDLKTQNLAKYFYSESKINIIISVEIKNSIIYIFGKQVNDYYLLECQIIGTSFLFLEDTPLPFNDLPGISEYLLDDKVMFVVKLYLNVINVAIINKKNKTIFKYTFTMAEKVVDLIAEKIVLNNKDELNNIIIQNNNGSALLQIDNHIYLYILYTIPEINDNIFLIFDLVTKKMDCVRIYKKDREIGIMHQLLFNLYLNKYIIRSFWNNVYELDYIIC